MTAPIATRPQQTALRRRRQMGVQEPTTTKQQHGPTDKTRPPPDPFRRFEDHS